MKKLLVVLVILVLGFAVVGCNGDHYPRFTTPEWIRGTWEGEYNQEPYKVYFFVSDILINDKSQLDYGQWTEETTDTTYRISINQTTYLFTLNPDQTLRVELNGEFITNLTQTGKL